MNYKDKHIKNKKKYIECKQLAVQVGGNGFQDNLYLNKSLFYTHVDAKYKTKRLSDFNAIYKKLKNHLEIQPKEKAKINKKKMRKYINMHNKENRPAIEKLLAVTQYISFDTF